MEIVGQKCNMVTCQLETLVCPPPPDCTGKCTGSSISLCPTGCTSNSTCIYLDGKCVGGNQCNCPQPPAAQTCRRTACFGQQCALDSASVPCTSPTRPTAPCAYFTACSWNTTTSKCDWINNEPYLNCIPNPVEFVDECQKQATACHCVNNPDCGLCTYSLATSDGVIPINRCMRKTQAECVLPTTRSGLGGSFFNDLKCTVPLTYSNLLDLISNIPIQKLQNQINQIFSPSVAKYSLVVEGFLQANAITGSNGIIAKYHVSIVGSGTPSKSEVDLICAAHTNVVQILISTTVTQCSMTLVGVTKKRSIGQSTLSESTFLTELNLVPPVPSGNTVSTAQSWVLPAVGVIIALVVITLIIVVICCCCRSTNKQENPYFKIN